MNRPWALSAGRGPIPSSDILRPGTGDLEPSSRAEFPIIQGTRFKIGQWDPALLSQVALAQFSETRWQSSLTVAEPPTDEADIHSEIERLVQYASVLRPARMPEIVAHSQGSTLYFANAGGIYPNTRPAMWTLILLAYTVGQMVAMHFKYRFQRARPVQLYPALLPPISTPQHPSYPSSHAIQSHLAAGLLSLVDPGLHGPLVALAGRIAHGREVAGLHYPSDTEAGTQLAQDLLAIVKEVELVKSLLERASAEMARQ